MAASISKSSCAITDQACLCADPIYTAALEECVVANCTIRQSLSMSLLYSAKALNTDGIATKNVTTSACGAPIRDRTHVVSYTGVAGGIVALIVFILRLMARLRCCGGIFGLDDLTMMFAMVEMKLFQTQLSHTLTMPSFLSFHSRHSPLSVCVPAYLKLFSLS